MLGNSNLWLLSFHLYLEGIVRLWLDLRIKPKFRGKILIGSAGVRWSTPKSSPPCPAPNQSTMARKRAEKRGPWLAQLGSSVGPGTIKPQEQSQNWLLRTQCSNQVDREWGRERSPKGWWGQGCIMYFVGPQHLCLSKAFVDLFLHTYIEICILWLSWHNDEYNPG